MNRRSAALLLVTMVLAGCSSRPQTAPPAATPVKVARVRHLRKPATVAVSGSVVSPENPANFAFLVSGRVIRVVPREGDFVTRGQVLAEIDPTDYTLALNAATAQAAAARAVLDKAASPVRPEVLEQARISYERARDEHERMKALHELKSLPPNDYQKFRAAFEAARQQYEMARTGGQKEDRAQAQASLDQALAAERIARKRLSDATLTASTGGFVMTRAIEVGDIASPGRPVFQIVQLDPVEINVGVPETDISLVRLGQPATVQIPALPGGVFEGRVQVINVAADPSTRTYMVRIRVPNPQRVLRLGMIAEAQIRGSETLDVLTLPGDSIVHDPQGGTLVFVYFPEQKRVYSRRVETGTVHGNEIEIRKGLSDAEAVVVAGQDRLRDGTLVSADWAPPEAK